MKVLLAGARPVVADALDRDALVRAVEGLSADAVIHELTALRKPRAGPLRPPGGGPDRPHLAAMLSTEQQAFGAPEGIALRYGLLYGGDAGRLHALLARRGLPVARGGLLGWVHCEDAAAATVAALEHGRPGQAYNVVDDLPATWQEVYTAMAEAFGAPPPRRIPRWLFRLAAPYVASFASTPRCACPTQGQGRARLAPAFPTYRDGIRAMREVPWRSHGRSGAGTRSA
jgi:nucleoside-diphosphate-sugar epimerase